MSWSWPQILYLLLSGAALVIAWEDHGKPREGTYNAVPAFVATLISWALLWWGGFFNG